MENYSFRVMDAIEVSFAGALKASGEYEEASSDCGSGGCSGCAGSCGPKQVAVYEVADGVLTSTPVRGGGSGRNLSASYVIVEQPAAGGDATKLALRAYRDAAELDQWLTSVAARMPTLAEPLRAQLRPAC